MTYKNKEDQLAYQKRWRAKNRVKVNAYGQYNQAERRRRNREIVAKAKDQPCMDCGIKYPTYVMDFDHIGNKQYNVSQMVSSCSKLELIQQEIEKCEVVCSNCHRQRTFDRKQLI